MYCYPQLHAQKIKSQKLSKLWNILLSYLLFCMSHWYPELLTIRTIALIKETGMSAKKTCMYIWRYNSRKTLSKQRQSWRTNRHFSNVGLALQPLSSDFMAAWCAYTKLCGVSMACYINNTCLHPLESLCLRHLGTQKMVRVTWIIIKYTCTTENQKQDSCLKTALHVCIKETQLLVSNVLQNTFFLTNSLHW